MTVRPAELLKFTRLPDPTTDLADANGAYPIDVDGDGQADLVVLRNGESEILRGSAAVDSKRRTLSGRSTAATPGRRPSARPGKVR
jgi:hypothetical protein